MDWPASQAESSTLFSKAIPMLLRPAGQGEQRVALVVTISRPPRCKALRVRLTSETELVLLHQLTVDEDDFQTLKAEQGIVVDFASFPTKLASLLDRCVAATGDWPPKFQATLASQGVQSVLRITETNDFKQLAHISLVFQAGSDAAVKELLAGRLRETQQSLAETAAALVHTRTERDQARASLEASTSEAAEARLRHEAQLRQAAAEAAAQLAAAGEEHERRMSAAAAGSRQRVAAAAEQAEALRSEAAAAQGGRAALSAQLESTAQALAAAHADRQQLEGELAAAKAAAARAEAEAAERGALATDLRGSLRALEGQAAAQAKQLEQQGEQLRAAQAEAHGAEAQRRAAAQRGDAAERRGQEADVEAQQAKRLIERLTEDLRLVREKMRRNQAVIERQEAELEARHSASESAAAGAARTGQALAQAQAEAARLAGENGGLQRELQECSQQLRSSEQMIRWLNDQLNEAHRATAPPAGPPGEQQQRMPQPRPAAAMEPRTVGRENQRPAQPAGPSVPKLKSRVGQQIVASHCGGDGA